MEQEQMMQMQILQQEVQELNQQMQLIEQTLSEMQELNTSLDEIKKDETKEIIANIGKKVYLPVEIKKKELFVEVGKGTFVKKSILETKEVVKNQIKKLLINKDEITRRLEEVQVEVNNLIQIYVKENQKKKEEIAKD